MSLSRRRFVAASAAVPLFAPSLALAQAKEFRLGLITPNGHSWNKAALKLGETLKTATDGRLTMTVFHSGQLGNESAMMQQLQSGALDMGLIQAAELGSRVPHVAAINAPYIVRSTPAVAKFVRHPGGAQAARGAAARNRHDRPRLGHHRHARRVLDQEPLDADRHQGHEAAHQPDAGVSRLLRAGRSTNADSDAAGVRRHVQRPGRRPGGGHRVFLEPAFRQGFQGDPADERGLHADGGGRVRPRLAVVAGGRPRADHQDRSNRRSMPRSTSSPATSPS